MKSSERYRDLISTTKFLRRFGGWAKSRIRASTAVSTFTWKLARGVTFPACRIRSCFLLSVNETEICTTELYTVLITYISQHTSDRQKLKNSVNS
jgi:hypothetical protein